MVELGKAFVASGWLDRNVAAESLTWPDVGSDILPWLMEIASTKHAQLLARSCQRGAQMTLGWPGGPAERVESWLGPRLLWWPRGVPDGRKVAWVSSRLRRAIDERADWFAVLRSATAKLDTARDVLLTAPSTTVDRFLERAAILFGLRRLRVHLDERRSLVDWLTRLRRQLQRNSESKSEAAQLSNDSDVFVSPILNHIGEPEGVSPRKDSSAEQCLRADAARLPECSSNADGQTANGRPFADLPLSDRVLVAAADHVFALQVRPNGNLHRLLRARLSDSAWPIASVWLALGDELVPGEVASELQSLGAVGWWLFVADAASVGQSTENVMSDASCIGHTELPWPDGEYLVHWTRRRDGPWPDQSEGDFIDDLLMSREAVSHSAFAALSRIVQQRRLLPSAAGIRGDVPVVSFSAKSLSDVTQQRTFRAHRGRWDCEAYGLCIRREWLQARGAKPVLYGDDAQWERLSPSEQPFFQLKTTRSRGGAKTIDWSHEAEWRVPHDIDLSEASRDDLRLFVPTQAEARQLAATSPWPVICARSDPIDGVEPRSTT